MDWLSLVGIGLKLILWGSGNKKDNEEYMKEFRKFESFLQDSGLIAKKNKDELKKLHEELDQPEEKK